MSGAGDLSVGEDAYDVEAYGLVVRGLFLEVLFGHRTDGGLFAWGYGFHGVSEARPVAELHFHEDQGIAVAYYEVEFSVAGAVVALDKLVTPARQESEGEFFPPSPGGLIAQAPTPA